MSNLYQVQNLTAILTTASKLFRGPPLAGIQTHADSSVCGPAATEPRLTQPGSIQPACCRTSLAGIAVGTDSLRELRTCNQHFLAPVLRFLHCLVRGCHTQISGGVHFRSPSPSARTGRVAGTATRNFQPTPSTDSS